METAEETPGAAIPIRDRATKGIGTALRRARIGRHRTPLIAGAALLWLMIGSSFSAAAPTYNTDWSTPVNLGPVVNSTASESGPAISADGLSLFFSSDQTVGGFGLRDIWVTQRATTASAWGAPVHLGSPINTAFDDYVPSLSSDGHWMFFASTRPGGFGGADLYQSYRPDIHDDFGWETPTNLGAGVNTPAAENGNGYTDNGGHPQIYFGSDRLGPAGNSSIYVTNLQPDGTWGPASQVTELGLGNRPNLRLDGLEIFFYSNRPGGVGGIDLWTATRASLDMPWSMPVDVPNVNSTANDQHPDLSADGATLYFFSGREGTSGPIDLWMSTRDLTAPVLTLPSAVSADATGPNGAAVSYTATATDNLDPSPLVSCVPGSGGVFAIDDSTVSCTATDAHSNSSSGSFTVHVEGAGAQLTDLAGAVAGVGPGKDLAITIGVARFLLAHDQVRATCVVLAVFNLEARAQAGRRIPTAQAAGLIVDSNRIKDVLNC
jgi:hypothetical protein